MDTYPPSTYHAQRMGDHEDSWHLFSPRRLSSKSGRLHTEYSSPYPLARWPCTRDEPGYPALRAWRHSKEKNSSPWAGHMRKYTGEEVPTLNEGLSTWNMSPALHSLVCSILVEADSLDITRSAARKKEYK